VPVRSDVVGKDVPVITAIWFLNSTHHGYFHLFGGLLADKLLSDLSTANLHQVLLQFEEKSRARISIIYLLFFFFFKKQRLVFNCYM
jgi:hypothetical protein